MYRAKPKSEELLSENIDGPNLRLILITWNKTININDDLFNIPDCDVDKDTDIIINPIKNTYTVEPKIGVSVSLHDSKVSQLIS